MENLIRIKFDPKRGGAQSIDFLRPCFRLENWPSEAVEIWTSTDSGVNWDKLSQSGYRTSYYGDEKFLYVSLLVDITGITHIAFFDIDGGAVGVGWEAENPWINLVNAGWSTGIVSGKNIGAGFTLLGPLPSNVPLVYRIRRPNEFLLPIGYEIAAPSDFLINAGCSIGTVFEIVVASGGTIMGLREFPSSLIALDDDAIEALVPEAAARKQKLITLNGTTPEDLD